MLEGLFAFVKSLRQDGWGLRNCGLRMGNKELEMEMRRVFGVGLHLEREEK